MGSHVSAALENPANTETHSFFRLAPTLVLDANTQISMLSPPPRKRVKVEKQQSDGNRRQRKSNSSSAIDENTSPVAATTIKTPKSKSKKPAAEETLSLKESQNDSEVRKPKRRKQNVVPTQPLKRSSRKRSAPSTPNEALKPEGATSDLEQDEREESEVDG